jgi:predicted transcriptional regulator
MATTLVVTVCLEPELGERPDRLAKAQRRSRSLVAAEAIREYVMPVPQSCSVLWNHGAG